MDENEYDNRRQEPEVKVEKVKKPAKKKSKVYQAKIIMRSKNSIGVLFKGYGIHIHTNREFPEDLVDVYYVNDIGQPNFECWLQ